MKSSFYAVCVVLILLLSCNKENGVSSNKIQFWHFWSEPYQLNVIKGLVEKFEKENNCTVELTELSWNDGKTKLFAAFNSKTAPDVLELGSDWVAQFSSSGVLAQLDNKEMEISKFIDFSTAPSYYDNKLYALPWIVDTRVLFYNVDLLEKVTGSNIPPKTFDSLLLIAEKINNIEGIYGFGANGSDRHRLYKKLMAMFWTFGGDILDKSGKPVINTEQNIKALNMYVELSREGLIETQRQLDAVFTEGKLGFQFSGGWLIEKIKNENPNLHYNVALIPDDNTNKGVSFAGGEYIAVNAKSKNMTLAKKLAKYLTDGRNSIEFCKKIIEAGFPADKNYFQDNFYKAFPKRLVFAEQLKYARMTPVNPQWLDIEQIIEEAAVEALYGKKDSRESLNNAQEKLQNLLK